MPRKKQAKWKAITFTLHNWTEDERLLLFNCELFRYILMGEELGESGQTPHLQGYAQIANANGLTMTYIKKEIGITRIHLEEAKGTREQNWIYCHKEEINFWERGKPCMQGERTDLNDLRDDLVEGVTDVDNIALTRPFTYHMYGRTLTKIEDIVMRKRYRTKMTKGIWIWGSTGIGKSHAAFDIALMHGYDDTYVRPKDGGWWDAYRQQKLVIINEFRGDIEYDDLLQLLDKWPYSVRRRCREPVNFTSELVIITSSLPPEEIYKNRNSKDSIAQLKRRLTVIHLKGIDEEVLEGNTGPLANELDDFT